MRLLEGLGVQEVRQAVVEEVDLEVEEVVVEDVVDHQEGEEGDSKLGVQIRSGEGADGSLVRFRTEKNKPFGRIC